MACGVGLCLGCAVPDGHGHHRAVCREGPVFDAAELDYLSGIGSDGGQR